MKKFTFAKGALLLAVATGLGKIFSAIFKIPLDRFFLREEGMAVFNAVYNTYVFFFSASQAGFPLAISRLIAQSKSKEEEDEILSVALSFLLVFLSLSALFIFLFSEQIAHFVGISASALGFRIMAPALVFCAVTAVFKGFFQGKRYMSYSAFSQVSDSFGRLAVGFSVAYLLLGSSLSHISAGALTGVTAGAVLSALILSVSFFKLHRPISFSFSGKTLKKLLCLAVPITVTTSLHAIFNMLDTAEVVFSLNRFAYTSASASFGILGRAAMLYALPVSIATAVASSAIPSVADSLKTGDKQSLMRDSSLAVRLALFISVPCAFGFMAIPDGIFTFLFDSADLSSLLAIIAPSAIFSSVACVIASILQAMEKTKSTLISALVAIAVKAVLTPVLIRFIGINGAAAATSIAYLVFLALLTIRLSAIKLFPFSASDFLIKPLLCGTLCFLTAFVTSQFFSAPISIICAAPVYLVFVIVTKFISFDELKQIFGG